MGMLKNRWVRRGVVTVIACALGFLTSVFIGGAWLGAVGVLIGLLAAFGLEVWDDRHAPDLVQIFNDALK